MWHYHLAGVGFDGHGINIWPQSSERVILISVLFLAVSLYRSYVFAFFDSAS